MEVPKPQPFYPDPATFDLDALENKRDALRAELTPDQQSRL